MVGVLGEPIGRVSLYSFHKESRLVKNVIAKEDIPIRQTLPFERVQQNESEQYDSDVKKR
jgi:hypothetical protein